MRVLTLAAGVLLAVGIPATTPTTGLFDGSTCRSMEVCERNADIGPAVEQMLDAQVATFGPRCVDPAVFVGIPATALVRNARHLDGDTGVVREISLDAALAAATAGKVYVLRACDAQ